MTTAAKEVIAAAILDDARHMGALAGELPIEQRVAAAILAALEAAGLAVVEKKVPAYSDEAMLVLARSAVAMGKSWSSFVQAAEAMYDQASDELSGKQRQWWENPS